jgi:hypothetical protein
VTGVRLERTPAVDRHARQDRFNLTWRICDARCVQRYRVEGSRRGVGPPLALLSPIKYGLAWLLGVPIPILVMVYLLIIAKLRVAFTHAFARPSRSVGERSELGRDGVEEALADADIHMLVIGCSSRAGS